MAITQLRGFGAFSGGRYGAFSGKARTRHVGELTQLRAFGAFTGGRYGSFAGKTPGVPSQPPVVEVIIGGIGVPPRFRIRPPVDDDEEAILLVLHAWTHLVN